MKNLFLFAGHSDDRSGLALKKPVNLGEFHSAKEHDVCWAFKEEVIRQLKAEAVLEENNEHGGVKLTFGPGDITLYTDSRHDNNVDVTAHVNRIPPTGNGDLAIEFHVNSGGGVAQGPQVYVHDNTGKANRELAKRGVEALARMMGYPEHKPGQFTKWTGVRNESTTFHGSIWFLSRTKVPAQLYELFFGDNEAEINRYDEVVNGAPKWKQVARSFAMFLIDELANS